jgi:hypothetical protein
MPGRTRAESLHVKRLPIAAIEKSNNDALVAGNGGVGTKRVKAPPFFGMYFYLR